MLGLLAILALSNSGGNSCRCPGSSCCANRELPTFLPARGTMESTEELVEAIGALTDEGFGGDSFTVTAPLNVLTNPKNIVPVSEGLQITRDGIYEISYNMDVRFDQVGEDVAAYVQLNGTADLFALTGTHWTADGAFQPAVNTARITFGADDELRLAVSVFVTPGTLTIAPGAKLTVRRVG